MNLRDVLALVGLLMMLAGGAWLVEREAWAELLSIEGLTLALAAVVWTMRSPAGPAERR